jgi:hypothetical protein
VESPGDRRRLFDIAAEVLPGMVQAGFRRGTDYDYEADPAERSERLWFRILTPAHRGRPSTIGRDLDWLARYARDVLPTFEADAYADQQGSSDPLELESRNKQLEHLAFLLVEDGELPPDSMDEAVLPATIHRLDVALRKAAAKRTHFNR